MLCVPLIAVGLTACGSTVSTSSFKGEAHVVAQTISNLQADATAAEQKKICANDLARSVVSRLGGTKGCETAIKSQLAEVDSLELNVKSIAVTGATATANATSTYEGKTRPSKLSLLKEGGKWKVSGL